VSDAAILLGPERLGVPSGPDAGEEESPVLVSRDRDLLAGRRNSGNRRKLIDRLDELFGAVQRAYEDQNERAADTEDYWDCFNCVTNDNRFYNGRSEIYWPIVHDALVALVTRFSNQMCPQSGRYIEEVAADGTQSSSLIGLLEHYLREAKFETQVLKPLLLTGFVEGQLNLYVDWTEREREIVSRETHGPRVPMLGGDVEAPGEEIDDIKVETVREGQPVYDVLHDTGIAVWPATVDSLDEAFTSGGGVAIARHWTKAKIDRLVKQGAIRKEEAAALKDSMDEVFKGKISIEKHLAEMVGIHPKGLGATVWEVWTMLPLDDEGGYDEEGAERLCRVFLGPNRAQLGAKRNPYWNDLCPLLSAPLTKTAGVFKGKSPISYGIDSIQYEANDAVNEGADSAVLSAAPIIRRDPEKSNGPLVFGVGAIWDGAKDAIDILTFPDLTPRAVTRVQMALGAIFQSLGVNPSMLPQQTRTGKPNQAQVAQEQQVDLLTTAEGVKVPVESILTPLLGLTVDFDYQFRDHAITIRGFGELGKRAELEQVGPVQNRKSYVFLWRGAEQVKMMMTMQQAGTAWMNVMMQPNMQAALAKAGYAFDPAPLVLLMNQNLFGSFVGAQVLINQRELLTMDPETENQILVTGQHLHTHPLDQDPQHMQSHVKALQMGDPHGTIAQHIAEHVQSMQMKIAASMQRAGAQQGMPPQAPGGPGAPQPGAMPMGPHAAKGPAGMIHPDNAAQRGVVQIPRRT
jgi:hypothetical protein